MGEAYAHYIALKCSYFFADVELPSRGTGVALCSPGAPAEQAHVHIATQRVCKRCAGQSKEPTVRVIFIHDHRTRSSPDMDLASDVGKFLRECSGSADIVLFLNTNVAVCRGLS